MSDELACAAVKLQWLLTAGKCQKMLACASNSEETDHSFQQLVPHPCSMSYCVAYFEKIMSRSSLWRTET